MGTIVLTTSWNKMYFYGNINIWYFTLFQFMFILFLTETSWNKFDFLC